MSNVALSSSLPGAGCFALRAEDVFPERLAEDESLALCFPEVMKLGLGFYVFFPEVMKYVIIPGWLVLQLVVLNVKHLISIYYCLRWKVVSVILVLWSCGFYWTIFLGYEF